jgi:lipoprotein-releasing system ATP-binding protein
MNEAVIRCSMLSKVFYADAETLTILSNLDFTVERNATVSITGQSGCGKSTLLSILGGLDGPSSGELWVDGVALHQTPERHLAAFRLKSVGFVFQFHYLLKDFSALENVALPAIIGGSSRADALDRAGQLLSDIGLADRITHYPSKLSGGERQRVAIVRALINEPALVLADEPTGNLDERSAKVAEELLFTAVQRSGAALLIVTHDPRLAELAPLRYRLHEGVLTSL